MRPCTTLPIARFICVLALGLPFASGCNPAPQPVTAGPGAEQPAAKPGMSDASAAPTGPKNSQPIQGPDGQILDDLEIPDSIPAADVAGESVAATPVITQPYQPTSTPDGIGAGVPIVKEEDLSSQSFTRLQPRQTKVPAELLEHITEIDTALRELMVHGQRGLLEESDYIAGGLRLGKMKLVAAENLLNAPAATVEQKRAGQVAKLVALSHLSGLRDVNSSKMLRTYAQELALSDDENLAHEGRVVLLGFEVQALLNGVTSDPNILVQSCGLLLEHADRCGFPEFIAVQNAATILQQQGHAAESEAAVDLLASAYLSSPAKNLRGEAWLLSVRNSATAAAFFQALGGLGNETTQPEDVAAAARALLKEHPGPTTLEKLASTLGELDANGQLTASGLLMELITTQRDNTELPKFQADGIASLLSFEAARQSLLGGQLDLSDLTLLDGGALDSSTHQGKVILVEFWASWCVNCLTEIPHLRSLHEQYAAQGFDIIAINMDENLSAAQTFVDQQKFPWNVVRSADHNALGFQSVAAKRMGVDRIPFTLLVDRSGKITAINLRGPKLAPAVGQLLGATP